MDCLFKARCTALLAFVIFVLLQAFGDAEKSFSINKEKQCFWKDNSECFQYISGSIHYTRIPWQYWEDRLLKVRAAGLNAIQAYVPWNAHEPEPGQYDFTGNNDLLAFLDIAKKLGLYVLLRPGPYSCAAIDMGGFPYWLLRYKPNIRMRTSDPDYLIRVKSWFDVLLPMIKPYLYANGGPILMVQVENEYGSFYACDSQYMAYLRDLMISHLSNDTLLYTVDGPTPSDLKCGTIPGVYPTVDFGIQSSSDDVEKNFEEQLRFAGAGPKVNTEYYSGWRDQWEDTKHHTVKTTDFVKTMKDMLSFNASINVYMMAGGTNFAYISGAYTGPNGQSYRSTATTYDFDSPISESGDPTPKLYVMRSLVETYTGKPVKYPVPNATKKVAYGRLKMKRLGTIVDVLSSISEGFQLSKYPQSAETLAHGYGYILYITKLKASGTNLTVPIVHDRAYFMRNGTEYLGLLERNLNMSIVPKAPFKPGDIIHILLENRGRDFYAKGMNDSKGIFNVSLDGAVVTDWIQYPILLEKYFNAHPVDYDLGTHPINTIDLQWNASSVLIDYLPSVYIGKLKTSDVADTFFDPTNWGKGQLLINGFNLGRYWPSMGPQQTLYVPKYYLKNGTSTIMLLELESPGNCIGGVKKIDCYASFTNIARLDKPGAANLTID